MLFGCNFDKTGNQMREKILKMCRNSILIMGLNCHYFLFQSEAKGDNVIGVHQTKAIEV